ncbi:MAG: hypothetical protein ABSB26_08110 [Nitrososphaerales archaeon]
MQASGPAMGAALLVVGVIVGAGLVLITFYATGSLTPRTMTGTTTETLATTVTTTVSRTQTASWKPAAGYPLQASDRLGVFAQQCVNSTAYIYCVGGQDANEGPHNSVYTSSAFSSPSSNITSWTLDLNLYPQTIDRQSCVASSGYVYCVGGTNDDAGDDTNASYYAPLTSNGVVSAWVATKAFPIPVDSQSCVASSGYIYCVGGFGEALGTNATSFASNFVYYASLSSSGIGSWSKSTSYPAGIFLPSCFAAKGYIYCVGGVDNISGNPVSTDYYAPLSSSGVGAWTQTEAYPIVASNQACAVSSDYVYCVGGAGSNSYLNAVFFATVSSEGIGAWAQAADYPLGVMTDCVISSGNIYCVGGSSSSSEYSAAYYLSLESALGVTTTG